MRVGRRRVCDQLMHKSLADVEVRGSVIRINIIHPQPLVGLGTVSS